MDHFYRIIVFFQIPSGTRLPNYDTVGYYKYFKDAEQCVRNNSYDINEQGAHPAAMIIETEYGMYPFCPARAYYEWKNGEYIREKEPKVLHGYNI